MIKSTPQMSPSVCPLKPTTHPSKHTKLPRFLYVTKTRFHCRLLQRDHARLPSTCQTTGQSLIVFSFRFGFFTRFSSFLHLHAFDALTGRYNDLKHFNLVLSYMSETCDFKGLYNSTHRCYLFYSILLNPTCRMHNCANDFGLNTCC